MSTPKPAGSDPTRIIHGADRPWIPVPAMPGAFAKLLVADETLKRVVFLFRFAPGAVLPRHRHLCHAIAYTICGEWEYEQGTLRAGSIAYEPVGSEHTPSSAKGAELVVVLQSESDEFLENLMPDGSTVRMDTRFFKMMESLTPEQIAKLQMPGPVG